MVRVVAWIRRFITNCRSRAKVMPVGDCKKPFLHVDELKEAQLAIVHGVQQKEYPELFTEKIRHSSLAQNLRVELQDGFLWCKGRMGRAEMSAAAKSPLLMPASSEVTKLIISSIHKMWWHSGIAHTLARLRLEFWVPKGRQTVMRVVHGCHGCARFQAKPFAHPPMPDLPKDRVSAALPFAHTGVDYFGPLFCKDSTGKQTKVWVALFTCLVVRAIHLELVADLSTEGFQCAYRRFVARRGQPLTMLSDNGSQFKLFDKVLKQATQACMAESNLQGLDARVTHGVQWRFIPEASPWMGGVCERLVGVVKTALKKSLGRAKLNFEQLRTLLVEVEEVVNSRPLVYVGESAEDSDNKILTPQAFLTTGRRDKSLLLPETDPKDPAFMDQVTRKSVVLENWKIGQFHLNEFWRLWQEQYLASLRSRHGSDRFKKIKSEIFRTPVTGEVVLVKSDSAPRGLWKLAKIEHLNISVDKLIRSVRLRMVGSKELITRPVSVLYPLEMDAQTKSRLKTEDQQMLACSPSTQFVIQSDQIRDITQGLDSNVQLIKPTVPFNEDVFLKGFQTVCCLVLQNPDLADVEMAEAVQSLMQATPVIENIHVGQETVSKAGVGQSSAAAQGQGSLVPTAGSRVSPLEKELPGPTKTITKAAKKDWWMQKNRRVDRRCEAEGHPSRQSSNIASAKSGRKPRG